MTRSLPFSPQWRKPSLRFRSETLSATSSDTLMPVAYISSRMARSRIRTGLSPDGCSTKILISSTVRTSGITRRCLGGRKCPVMSSFTRYLFAR